MSKIEQRPLTENELEQLIEEASESETVFMRELKEPAIFFNSQIEQFGILSNSRPIYFWAVEKKKDNHYYLWTVVNKDVKEQFSIFKICKRNLDRFNKEHGELYSIMYKGNEKNIKWTERLGFNRIAETENKILFKRG